MARRAELKRHLEQMETTNSLRGTNKRVRNVADGEERLEDKINLIQDEGEERLEDKINLIQDEVKQLKETLNTIIKRMNDFHQWMDMVMDKSIRSYEENDLNEQSIKI